MLWYEQTGKQPETVISTRVRIARNINGYPFEGKLTETAAKELIEKVSLPLEQSGFEKVTFEDVSPLVSSSYVEKHLISPEFASKKTPHALFLQETSGLAVMVCEEDHLRIQCILPGLAVEECYRNAQKAEKRLDEEFDLSYSDSLGYLTHCPTNLGTGLRISVMMFLPALTMGGYMNSLANQLSKVGLTVRGLFGEGSGSAGNLYQISNQVTLGITEESTIAKINDAVKQITESEEKARKSITGESAERLTDRIRRSLGTLLYAYRLSSSEMMKLLSDVRLGISLGKVKEVTYGQINRLLAEGMPATLTLSAKKQPKTDAERDVLRAETVQKILSEKK